MSVSLLKGFWNIPNMLSLFRLLLVPALVLTYFLVPGTNHIIALVIFVVATITDVFDGIIARSTNQITMIGTVLDPFADKLLKIATLVCFGVDGVLPIWLVVMLLFIDIAMIITGLCLLKKQITIPSNFVGKLGTVVMSLGLLMCFLTDTFGSWGFYTICAGLCIIVISVIIYIVLNAGRVFKKKNKSTTPQTEEQQNQINE